MDLSICIVSWNVRDLLKNCLDSIARAEPRLRYEVLVADNCSSDGSADMVEADFPEVELIRNRENRGFATACNQSLKRSRGRYLLLLNPDTAVLPGGLEEMIKFLDAHPGAGGGACRLLNSDGSRQRSIRTFPTRGSILGEFTILGDFGFFRKARRRYLGEGFNYEREARVEQPMGAALFLRKEAVEKVGFMDKAFFLYFEEVDLCRRLQEAGYPLWYNPRASIIHFGGGSTEQVSAQSTFWLLQSLFYYLRKHSGRGKTYRFKIFFKPFFILGLLWGLARNGASLAGKRISGASPLRIRKTSKRLERKWKFLTGHLLKFLLKV